nr:hypothetical protein [Nocardia beijingensis]
MAGLVVTNRRADECPDRDRRRRSDRSHRGVAAGPLRRRVAGSGAVGRCLPATARGAHGR